MWKLVKIANEWIFLFSQFSLIAETQSPRSLSDMNERVREDINTNDSLFWRSTIEGSAREINDAIFPPALPSVPFLVLKNPKLFHNTARKKGKNNNLFLLWWFNNISKTQLIGIIKRSAHLLLLLLGLGLWKSNKTQINSERQSFWNVE